MSTRVIAHRIDDLKKGTRPFLRRTLLDPQNQDVAALVKAVMDGFSKSAPVKGELKKDKQGNVLPSKFLTLTQTLSSKTPNPAFITMSRQMTLNLRREMKRKNLASGGYVVFVETFSYKPSRGWDGVCMECASSPKAHEDHINKVMGAMESRDRDLATREQGKSEVQAEAQTEQGPPMNRRKDAVESVLRGVTIERPNAQADL